MSRTRKSPVTRKQESPVEAAIKTIGLRFTQGQEIFEQCGPVAPRGRIEELAAQYGLNPDTVRKLRAFAAPETGFTKRELNQWFNKFRSKGNALTISHFVRLVSLRKGNSRDQLIQQALDLEWSAHRLQSEILAKKGRRRQGGRKPKVVAGEGFSAELAKTMWAWRRWLELHLEANPKMPIEIAKELKSLKRLIERVEGLLKE